jgi:hypothetical protein
MELRQAAGFEGLIVLALIYFVLSQLQKAGKAANKTRRPPAPPSAAEPGATQQEGLSLETILREIERVKQQKQLDQPETLRRPLPGPRPVPKAIPPRRAPPPRRQEVLQDERGPLGRLSQTKLPSAEEVEDRTSLDEGRSLEGAGSLESLEPDRGRRMRTVVDQDEEAEAVVQRRLKEAEARNRPHADADHRAFDQQIRQPQAPLAPGLELTTARLRQAVVWREILGPPKALE